MNVTCSNCQNAISIPDGKVPKGKSFSVACPKCRHKIAVPVASVGAGNKPSNGDAPTQSEALGTYDASSLPFNFVEQGVKTALVCEINPASRAKIKALLEQMSYHVITPVNSREVLKQMRFHNFDLLVLNERFDAINPDENNILRYMDRLAMHVRRDLFTVLLTNRFRTMDSMTAFAKSVHLIVNLKHIDEFDKILHRALLEIETFYHTFKEILTEERRL